MKIKTGLTIMAVMCMAVPAFSDTFPNDGYMLENKTYTNAATYENLGAYEGPVAATANYENVLYNISAGQYLAAGGESGTQCTAGNFCTGLTNATYDANNDQGLTACSTLESGAYPNSLAGAKANTDCYHACTTSDANIAHAATFTGNAYYGGTNTCELTGCDSGYHIKPGQITPDTTVQTNLSSGSASSRANVNASGTASSYASQYGLSDNNTWVVDFGSRGILYGRSRCSGVRGYKDTVSNSSNGIYNNPTTYDSLPDVDTGYLVQCYCQVTGYKPSGGVLQGMASPWIFNYTMANPTLCGNYCAEYCAEQLYGSSGGNYRATLVGTLGTREPGSCVSNTITITWSDASQADIDANNAGTATWGGDIKTPRAAATKPGKRFIGWTFGPAE